MNSETIIKATMLLKDIISVPSFSTKEDRRCEFLQKRLNDCGFNVNRKSNNLWIRSVIDNDLPVIMLNSHIDTVMPGNSWTIDPFTPLEKEGRVYGLGSNDAGGPLVAMIFAFMELDCIRDRRYNLLLVLSAEEEISGENGIASLTEEIGKVDLALIGEPTGNRMAVSERGLVVLDCVALGRAGHAAYNNSENAISKAVKDIQIIESLRFDKISDSLGEVSLAVTLIEGGTQQNVIPDLCRFVVDVRTNDCYSNSEIVDIIRSSVSCSVTPRSLRLSASAIDLKNPVVVRATEMGVETFGSKTLSDQAMIKWPSVKLGPGISDRSHIADEFIYIDELKSGIELYLKLLTDFKF